eukprot:7421440-Alexandrium_andersonii.AAC.1
MVREHPLDPPPTSCGKSAPCEKHPCSYPPTGGMHVPGSATPTLMPACLIMTWTASERMIMTRQHNKDDGTHEREERGKIQQKRR